MVWDEGMRQGGGALVEWKTKKAREDSVEASDAS